MLRLFAVENMSVGKRSAAALRRAILAALDKAGQRHRLGDILAKNLKLARDFAQEEGVLERLPFFLAPKWAALQWSE